MSKPTKKNKIVFIGPSDTYDLIKNSKLLFKNKELKNACVLGYLSNEKRNYFPYNKFKSLGGDKYLNIKNKNKIYIVNNAYSNFSRKKISGLVKASNNNEISVISNSTLFFSNIRLGKSNIIYPKVTLSTNCILKNSNIVSYNAFIGHDVKIGSFNFVGPGSNILGEVTIGNGCLIGANVTIYPGIKIGDYVNISAGTTVTKNISNNYSLINVNNLITYKKK